MSNNVGNFGEYQMRIPEQDYHTLLILIPDLKHRDAEIREKAWRQFWASPLADPYRMARSPRQVQRSADHRIIMK